MKVPVLVYHDITTPGSAHEPTSRDRYYNLDIDMFRGHLKYLYDNAFETTSIGISGEPNGRPVALTFDDGYASCYECFKLLKSLGFTATFFITTDFVGSEKYLTWDQVNEMQQRGMNIQSHTCSHPILTEIRLDQLRLEFAQSKHIIEGKLNKKVDSISIPQGFVNTEIISIAKDCGYKYIFTSEPGIYDTTADQIVRRLSIYNRTTMSQFERLVNMDIFEIKKQQLYKSLLSIPKRILGDKNYHSLRLKILDNFKFGH